MTITLTKIVKEKQVFHNKLEIETAIGRYGNEQLKDNEIFYSHDGEETVKVKVVASNYRRKHFTVTIDRVGSSGKFLSDRFVKETLVLNGGFILTSKEILLESWEYLSIRSDIDDVELEVRVEIIGSTPIFTEKVATDPPKYGGQIGFYPIEQ